MLRFRGVDEPWRRAFVWAGGSSYEAVIVINRLLTHLDPSTAALPQGLAYAVVAYLRRHPRIQAEDALALRWAPHVTDAGHAPVPGVVLIDAVHAVLWHLAAAGITWPIDVMGDDVLDACDVLIRAHAILDGHDGQPTLIAGAWRGLQLHRQGRCAHGISELQSGWIAWHLHHGDDNNPAHLAITSILAADCPATDTTYATLDHRYVAAWLEDETARAQTATTAQPTPRHDLTSRRGLQKDPTSFTSFTYTTDPGADKGHHCGAWSR